MNRGLTGGLRAPGYRSSLVGGPRSMGLRGSMTLPR